MFKKMFVPAVFAAALLSAPASANATAFRVEAGTVKYINLNVCSPRVALSAIGDGDTDLDFVLYDPDGNQVHADDDGTDMTYVTFRTRLFRTDNICRTFKLRVANLGEVWNEMKVTLEVA